MNSLDELIAELKRRPAMYLGSTSIDRLSAFISGWTFARDNSSDIETLASFQRWVAKKFDVTTSHHWDHIIPFYCMNDNEVLSRFFELYEEFKKSQIL
jgi:hypothetical protein